MGLLETPPFTFLRLHLLQPGSHPALLQCALSCLYLMSDRGTLSRIRQAVRNIRPDPCSHIGNVLLLGHLQVRMYETLQSRRNVFSQSCLLLIMCRAMSGLLQLLLQSKKDW